MKLRILLVCIASVLLLAACEQQSPATPATVPQENTQSGMCTAQYDPVCGRNGVTYSNRCMAEQNGALVAYPGECRESEGTAYDEERAMEGRMDENANNLDLDFSEHEYSAIHHTGPMPEDEPSDTYEQRQDDYQEEVDDGRSFGFYE